MPQDARGLAVTADDPAAVAHLDAAIESFCSLRRDSGEHLKRALASGRPLPLGSILRGYFMLLFGKREMLPRAEQAAAAAEAAFAAVGGTPREHRHRAALQAWLRGDLPAALAAFEAVLAEHPRDLLALRLAQHLYFYLGMSFALRDSVARVLPAWDEGVPGFGYVLGCRAFGLEECGELRAAEAAGRRAVACNPRDIWAAHAVAHVCEMENRVADGNAWLDALEPDWPGVNNFACHVHWHRCLFLLESRRFDEVLERYDREVRPDSTDEQLDISNAVALLWRLEQLGVDVGARWTELAERSRLHIGDHILVFPDMHYAMALAAAGDDAASAQWMDSARRYAAVSRETQAEVMREVGLALAAGAVAHRRREWSRAVELLLPIRQAIVRIGGSHAQRDLFHRMLIDAALRAGRPELARMLLGERAATRAADGWAGWHAPPPAPPPGLARSAASVAR